MEVLLTPELEKAVKDKVASGLYHDPGEVIQEALRQSLRLEADESWLRREAAIGYAQLEAGETVTIDSREDFLALIREV
jgi:antitoxin ParD1/3/4